MGQAEDLAAQTNFWEAVEKVNHSLAEDGLYISHFFEETQVVLCSDWKEHRVPIAGPWDRLALYRLSDGDLLLSKLMRDDPQDQADARFIYECSELKQSQVETLIARARVPAIPGLREQFDAAARRFLGSIS